MPFATTWMDLEGIMLCEVSQRKTKILHGLNSKWNLKNKTKQNPCGNRVEKRLPGAGVEGNGGME